jgi:hypothetical protein
VKPEQFRSQGEHLVKLGSQLPEIPHPLANLLVNEWKAVQGSAALCFPM